MNWHPHTERPELEAPASGLIATRGDDGAPFVLGMYVWDGARWESEKCDDEGGFLYAPEQHWWISEDELTEGL